MSRWEQETLARGGRVAVFTGTRAELLAGGGAFRVARTLAELGEDRPAGDDRPAKGKR